MSNKLGRDISGIDPITQKKLDDCACPMSSSSSGVLNDKMREPVPHYNQSEAEHVVQGNNNAWITLGRDRPGSRASGYGGKGHTQCGTIDLVVGRMGSKPKEMDGENKVIVDSNFGTDSARIYISQKTDIDRNFNLKAGSIGIANARSAVGIKADHVRIMGREGIKLVTKTDAENSQGGDVKSVLGIDLIAGNDDEDLQPIVKGSNMKEAMVRLVHHLDKLNGIVDGMLMIQMQFNAILTSHWHHSPFFGIPTTPSIPVVGSGIATMIQHFMQTKMSLMTHKANLQMYKATYLTVSGGKWILSRYNNVN